MSTIYRPISVFRERSIAHHRVLLLSIRVIHGYNEWMVIFYRLCEFERGKVIEVKLNLVEVNLLVHSSVYAYLLNVVISIWGVEHFRCIVWILLLSYACVYPNMSVA